MTESFVDLTYRGLSLGRRVKLAQVQPTSGYLETPAPMPVGTPIAIATDDGFTIDAIVTHVHEQVGSDQAPGMTVEPTLDDIAEAWWQARIVVAKPAPAPTEPTRVARPPTTPPATPPVTVRPRTHTVPAPPPTGVDAADWQGDLGKAADALAGALEAPGGKTVVMQAVTEPEPEPAAVGGRQTTVMRAVDQELLESLSRKTGDLDALITTGKHAIIDDGKKTVMMDAIDPAALGLDVSASGSFPATDDDDGNGDDAAGGDGDGASADTTADTSGPKKKRRRKRKG